MSQADPDGPGARLQVLRVYHSGVVAPWRQRERELRRMGVDVILVSPRRWNEGGRDVGLVAEPDEDVEAARTFGTHPYRFVYDPRPIWRAVRSGRVDVVDIHEEPASLAAAEVWCVARLAGCRAPFSLYCAQNIAKRYPVPFRWIERAMLRRAAGVHTCNREAGRILRTKGFSGLIRDLGLGVDVDRFAPGTDIDRRVEAEGGPDGRVGADDAPSGALRVGYVGRLERHKGVDGLIAAVAETPGVDLEVVGDGPERARLEALALSSGVTGRVRFAGFSDQGELADVYRRFDVVAVPSLVTPSWIEQFGRVAVEAMASGVVVVASRSGALPEVVGDAGLLVEPGDTAALAKALGELRDDPVGRVRRAEAGRIRAAEFSWAAVAGRQLDFYRQLDWFAGR